MENWQINVAGAAQRAAQLGRGRMRGGKSKNSEGKRLKTTRRKASIRKRCGKVQGEPSGQTTVACVTPLAASKFDSSDSRLMPKCVKNLAVSGNLTPQISR